MSTLTVYLDAIVTITIARSPDLFREQRIKQVRSTILQLCLEDFLWADSLSCSNIKPLFIHLILYGEIFPTKVGVDNLKRTFLFGLLDKLSHNIFLCVNIYLQRSFIISLSHTKQFSLKVVLILGNHNRQSKKISRTHVSCIAFEAYFNITLPIVSNINPTFCFGNDHTAHFIVITYMYQFISTI